MRDPLRATVNALLEGFPGSPMVGSIDGEQLRITHAFDGMMFDEDGDASDAYDAYIDRIRELIGPFLPFGEDTILVVAHRPERS